jgi:hypothetical protein
MADVKKSRGKLLTLWLGLFMLSNFWAAASYLLTDRMVARASGMPLGVLHFFGVMATVNVVLGVLLFMWKKRAFYGMCAVAVLVFSVNFLVLGHGLAWGILDLLGLTATYLLMKPKWKMFD